MKKGIVYVRIHEMLDGKVDFGRVMGKKHLFRILGETFHIPKTKKFEVLRELVEMKIVKDLGSRKNYNVFVNPIRKKVGSII